MSPTNMPSGMQALEAHDFRSEYTKSAAPVHVLANAVFANIAIPVLNQSVSLGRFKNQPLSVTSPVISAYKANNAGALAPLLTCSAFWYGSISVVKFLTANKLRQDSRWIPSYRRLDP